MPDPRFFEDLGPAPLSELARLTGAELVDVGAGDRLVSRVAVLAHAGPDSITFLTDKRYAAGLAEARPAACFLPKGAEGLAPEGCAVLVAGNPQGAYALAAQRLHRPRAEGAAALAPDAKLEEGVVLGPGAVVGPAAQVGRGTRIGANSVIGPGVAIGRDCEIGPNVTIGFALLGDRVKVLAGARIGEPGFGATAGPKGLIDIPQLGRVIVQDGVSIGANTTIDRGAYDDTVIGENTKIDNLVQIAHNVRVGRNCVMAAHTGISGSVTIGDGAQFGGRAGVADHVTIGEGARVGAAAGCMKDIPAGETWGGMPARPIREWLKETAWLARMASRRPGGTEMARRAPVAVNPTDIDITEIMERIPHRYPFLLVDRCEDYKASESIVGIKCVTVNEPFFPGHFPHYPVMPAVLLIEAMAQTGAVLMSKSLNVDVGGKAIFFMSADNCRFRSPVRPGDVVRMPVKVVRHRGDVFKFAGQAMVGDKVAAECEFAAMVVET